MNDSFTRSKITGGIAECLSARGGTKDGSEEWGYVPLRANVSMFYWFYKTTHPDGYRNRPIVLWVQGGPGFSGTGMGNFLELCPLDQNLNTRNSTWIQTANVLFVDNPAGVGFSIADNNSVARNTEEISKDLISVLKTFMEEHSYFQNSPFYIFGQSYGGKMATGLAYYLFKATQKNEIKCNLKGVGIGNGFVSPGDTIGSWSSIMYEMSFIDDVLYKNLSALSQKVFHAGEIGEWDVLTDAYISILEQIFAQAPGLNIYKLTDIVKPEKTWGLVYDMDIEEFMNNHVKDKLGIIPYEKHWEMFGYHPVVPTLWENGDFAKPVWHLVDEILKSSDIDVIVYSGQLDAICSTAGTLRWMNKLTWNGKAEFDKAERRMLRHPDINVPEMFVKSHNHLKMY